MGFITSFNLCIFILITFLYFYQIIYVGASLFGEKRKNHFVQRAKKQHRYGVVIAARNERTVIGELIRSIRGQNYPAELIDIFVVADNCTDDTAAVAREAGAIVYERFNTDLVGKGYALDYIFNIIHNQYGDDIYEGYFIFDADNLLDENYVAEMNKVFDSGYRVLTSYRNSKNYDTNWLTAGSSLWFLREAKYLNNSRMILNTSCAVSGTGFLVSSQIIQKNHGWKYHLLTEDIEFSIDSALQGETIGYCEKAVLYDEQPVTFRQSWNQRLRWSKGFYQVMAHYGVKLVKGMFRSNCSFLSCYDMFMTIAPATFVSLFCILMNVVFLILGLLNPAVLSAVVPLALTSILFSFVNVYVTLYAVGLLTTITEWKSIKCAASKKILYSFTFPLFILSYIPIAVVALFQKVEWKPIAHSVVKSVEELR